MLRENKGYFLLELLISLSGWILIASVFVPMMIVFNKQSVETQEKSEALHILYDYLQEAVVENSERNDFSVIQHNKRYDIVWSEGNGIKSEVSIQYEDVFGKTVQISESIQ
ncbi:competence type IV pilus minor pilin ComGE [Niallia sp. Krafla_26]|uniref:competence type IV pilus minor pilin ComGE n=1 Tax=Niallia sp. Krafla_26 TaxID=3064703 RepID=UPI003D16CC9E